MLLAFDVVVDVVVVFEVVVVELVVALEVVPVVLALVVVPVLPPYKVRSTRRRFHGILKDGGHTH